MKRVTRKRSKTKRHTKKRHTKKRHTKRKYRGGDGERLYKEFLREAA